MLFRYKINHYTMGIDMLSSNLLKKTNLLYQTTLRDNLVTNGKIYRLANQLLPHVDKSNMAQKHAAMLISGGKPLAIGYNHDRMTTRRKFIMSYHAEIHTMAKYFDTKNLNHYKKYLNDTEKCWSYKNTCNSCCGSKKSEKGKSPRNPSDLTPQLE